MALLNKPATPSASLILIPGGDGHLGVNVDGSFSGLRDNQLVRTREAYLAHGVATLTIDSGVNVAEAVAYMRKSPARWSWRAPAAAPSGCQARSLANPMGSFSRPASSTKSSRPLARPVHYREH
jgi:hypothetical protein